MLSNPAPRGPGAFPCSPDTPPAPSPQPPVDRRPNGAWAPPAGRTGQRQPRRQPAGPSDARPSPEGGVPRDSSPWNPNPGSWRPWGAVLGWIWPTPSNRCGSRGLPAPSRADSAVLRAPAGQPAPRQRRSGGGTEGGACRGPGLGWWRGEGAGGASGEAVPACPSAAAGPSSPLVQGHDGNAWHRGHPGWRGPRALPTLRAEPRSHGQGGWAPRPALGTPVPALGATPSPLPSPSLAASVLDSAHPPQAARSSQSKRGRVETAPGAHTNVQGSGRGEGSVGSTE